MIQIIPTLFSTTEEEYRVRFTRLKASSFSEDGWVQLDLMDNKFVPTRGVSLDIIQKYPNSYKKEAQLMVIDPGEWIDGLIELSVQRIIFPVEIDADISKFINQIKNANIEVGLSLNPESEIKLLDPYLEFVDSVLLMGVNPGFEDQKLNSVTFEKIKSLKEKVFKPKIGIDGGVNDTNIRRLVDAGVDYLAIGSYLFTGDFDENLETLWEAVDG